MERPRIPARRVRLHQLLHSATVWRQRLTDAWYTMLQTISNWVSFRGNYNLSSQTFSLLCVLKQEVRQRWGCLRGMRWLVQTLHLPSQARADWSSSEGWCKNTATSVASSSWWWETLLASKQRRSDIPKGEQKVIWWSTHSTCWMFYIEYKIDMWENSIDKWATLI